MKLVPSGPKLRRLPVGIAAGIRFNVDLDHHKRLYLGLYEIELNRYLKRFCKRGYTSFDVGGQWGYDALVLAKLTGGRVISFEAEPSFCEVMRWTFSNNPGLSPLLSVRHGWVGARSDPAGGQVTLDEVAYSEDGFVPDVIKIDIEGAELDALRGAKRILHERKPSLIIETHSEDLEAGCSALLREHGYDPGVVAPRKWLRDHRPSTFNGWLVAEGRDLRV